MRPIWGGFMGAPGGNAAGAVREPVRVSRSTPMSAPAQTTSRPAPRVGTLEVPESEHPRSAPVLLGLNSRAVATFAGFAAVGAFVLIVFLGSTIGVGPSAATATQHPERFVQPGASANDALTWSGGPAQTSLSVAEYGEQVAIATLTSSLHQVSTESVTFYADPDRSGNALQQFSQVFG
ncbi:MAG: hypothetical protein AAFO89_12420, partial [Planctomycetota bacterium]